MGGPIAGTVYTSAQALGVEIVHWLRLALMVAAAASIATGLVACVYRILMRAARGVLTSVTGERLVLARALTLALEFQLAADVIDTALAPGWEEVGMLAAIAVIRTLLNWSLTREIAEERERLSASHGRA